MVGVFLKYPAPGEVKTRLAETIGDEKAAECYRNLAELALARTMAPALYRRILYISPGERIRDFVRWLPDETFQPQRGETLGLRMADAIARLLSIGERAVIIGTDVPDISREHVAEAFAAMESSDLVLGPAHDGGYYLIGMKRSWPRLFEGIAWSTKDVFRETLQRASQFGLSVHLLPELYDIDTIEDYRDWQRRMSQQNQHLPQSRL